MLTILTVFASCGAINETTAPIDRPAEEQVPQDLRSCFDQLVPAPTEEVLTNERIFALIAELKASELDKARCGQRLLNWIKMRG